MKKIFLKNDLLSLDNCAHYIIQDIPKFLYFMQRNPTAGKNVHSKNYGKNFNILIILDAIYCFKKGIV